MPESRKIFGKMLVSKYSGEILGASLWGGREATGLGDLISLAVKNKIHFEKLNEIDFNYTPPLSPFHNIILILVKKLKKGLYEKFDHS
jgi:hypothetical protein